MVRTNQILRIRPIAPVSRARHRGIHRGASHRACKIRYANKIRMYVDCALGRMVVNWAMNKIPWWIDCEKGDFIILPGLLGIMMGPIGLGNLSTN